MKKALLPLVLLFYFLQSQAHPSAAIVCDSKGNIYYSDLEQVWKLEPAGRKTVVVPRVHTHDLYLDGHDNLYGQNSIYSGEATNKYYHSVWRLTKEGRLETIIPRKEGFYIENFSFAQDKGGNMFWVKNSGAKTSFMKTSSRGITTKMLDGDFRRVQWIRIINERVYFVQYDNIYAIDGKGVKPVALKLAGKGDAHNSLYNLWGDKEGNIYVANATKKMVQRLDRSGRIKTIYTSPGDWFATGGVFDQEGRLTLLEWNSKNEIRIIKTAYKV